MGAEEPSIAVAPEGVRPFLAEAVVAGGARVVPPDEAEALVWARWTAPPASSAATGSTRR